MARKLVHRIRKTVKWEAAHVLKGLPPQHPCSRMHGHSYRAEVILRADRLDDQLGMVLDFNVIKVIRDKLDHQTLNDILGDKNPTAENIAVFFYEALNSILLQLGEQDDVIVEKVVVHETETSSAEVEMVES